MANIYLRSILQRPLTFGELDANFNNLNQAIVNLNLGDLADVIVTGATNGDFLVYNNGNWVNTTLNITNYYGSFSDTTTQTVSGSSIPTVWEYNTTEITNGINIVNNTQITVENSGVYEIGYSAQIDAPQNANKTDVVVWARINGNDELRTASHVTLIGNNTYVLPFVSYQFNLSQGDFVEFVFLSSNNSVRIRTVTNSISPTYPASPSVIIVAKRIDMYTVTPGTPGSFVNVNTTSGVSGGGSLSGDVTIALNTTILTGTTGLGHLTYWDYTTGDQKLATSSMYQEVNGAIHQTNTFGTGEIWADGNIIANYSDERLKTDFRLIDNALEKINKLRSCTYYQNNLANKLMKKTNNERQIGLIAQDLLEVAPEVVKLAPFDTYIDEKGNRMSKTGENYLTIQYEKLVPLLVSAIQELSKEVERLKK
jgi:hypothetical protein